MREWWSKVQALLTGRRALASDLREELQAHLDMEIEENLSRGWRRLLPLGVCDIPKGRYLPEPRYAMGN